MSKEPKTEYEFLKAQYDALVEKQKTPSERIIPMDQFDDGSKQRALIRQLNKDVEYWKELAVAAELVIAGYATPCITSKEHNARINHWRKLKNQTNE